MKPKKTLLVFGFPLMLTILLPLCTEPDCADTREVKMIALALTGAAGLLVARFFATRLF